MTRRILIALFAVALAAPAQIPGIEIDGPFARVKRNEDGSETKFERGTDRRTMTKKTYTAQGHLTLSTVYRMDDNGNPVKCEIFDGLGNKLYKTQFGYSKKPGPSFGKLVRERLFDARVKRVDPVTREEMPIHMFIYNYNPDGTAQVPIGVTLIKGKTAEEIFGKGVESQAIPVDLEKWEKVAPSPSNGR